MLSPETRGCLRMKASVASSRAVGFPSALLTTRRARPLGCSRSAFIKCSDSYNRPATHLSVPGRLCGNKLACLLVTPNAMPEIQPIAPFYQSAEDAATA